MNFKNLIIVIIVGLTSCTFSSKQEDTGDKTGKEYTSQYICPMHCEGSGSDSAGQCPVCGMDYQINPNYESDVNVYTCPMHPEITGVAGDSCSKCGMALEPK